MTGKAAPKRAGARPADHAAAGLRAGPAPAADGYGAAR